MFCVLRRWRRVSNMNTARVGCAAVTVGGKLYVIGGSGPDRVPLASVEVPPSLENNTVGEMLLPHRCTTSRPIPGLLSATCLYLDRRLAWCLELRLADLTTGRVVQDAACAEMDGLIYVVGGFDGKESLDLVEVTHASLLRPIECAV